VDANGDGVADPALNTCDPDLGCDVGSGGVVAPLANASVGAITPATLAMPTNGASSVALILLVVALVLGLVLAPALAWRHFGQKAPA
jgi:hypothetical protein